MRKNDLILAWIVTCEESTSRGFHTFLHELMVDQTKDFRSACPMLALLTQMLFLVFLLHQRSFRDQQIFVEEALYGLANFLIPSSCMHFHFPTPEGKKKILCSKTCGIDNIIDSVKNLSANGIYI